MLCAHLLVNRANFNQSLDCLIQQNGGILNLSLFFKSSAQFESLKEPTDDLESLNRFRWTF